MTKVWKLGERRIDPDWPMAMYGRYAKFKIAGYRGGLGVNRHHRKPWIEDLRYRMQCVGDMFQLGRLDVVYGELVAKIPLHEAMRLCGINVTDYLVIYDRDGAEPSKGLIGARGSVVGPLWRPVNEHGKPTATAPGFFSNPNFIAGTDEPTEMRPYRGAEFVPVVINERTVGIAPMLALASPETINVGDRIEPGMFTTNTAGRTGVVEAVSEDGRTAFVRFDDEATPPSDDYNCRCVADPHYPIDTRVDLDRTELEYARRHNLMNAPAMHIRAQMFNQDPRVFGPDRRIAETVGRLIATRIAAAYVVDGLPVSPSFIEVVEYAAVTTIQRGMERCLSMHEIGVIVCAELRRLTGERTHGMASRFRGVDEDDVRFTMAEVIAGAMHAREERQMTERERNERMDAAESAFLRRELAAAELDLLASMRAAIHVPLDRAPIPVVQNATTVAEERTTKVTTVYDDEPDRVTLDRRRERCFRCRSFVEECECPEMWASGLFGNEPKEPTE